MKTATFIVVLLLLSSASSISAGLLAYGICQTGCNALVVACYAAAGATFGTGKELNSFRFQRKRVSTSVLVTAGAGIPAAIIACNAGLGEF